MSLRQSDQQTSEPPTATPPNRRKFFVLGFLLAVGLFLFFLPAILLNSPLKQNAIDYATSDIKGSVNVAQISAGWLSPVQIQGVVLNDENGNEILTIDSIKTSQTLLGFLSSNDYGTIEIVRPTIDLLIRPDGSNLEDALASYINAPATEPESSIPKIQFKIVDGIASIRSPSVVEPSVIEDINTLIKFMDGNSPLSAQLQMACRNGQQHAGTVAASFTVDSGQNKFIGESINAEIQTSSLPLSTFAPILTRFIGPANIAGAFDSEFVVAIDTKNSAAAIDVTKLNASQVAFVAPNLIGSDQFVARSLTLSGNLQLTPSLILAKNFNAETEFARVNADGKFDVQQLMQLASGAEIPTSGFQLDGVVDLAQITTMLPKTLRIRDGVEMNSGILQVQANTRNESGSQRMVVNADAANINFAVDGQNIVWSKPLRAVGVAGQRDGSLFLEEIRFQSDFLELSGAAALDQGNLQISGDLKKVMDQLGQVLDTGGLVLAGEVGGELNWQLDSENNADPENGSIPIRMEGRFNIKNPLFQYPGMSPWNEKQMDLTLNGNAVANTNGKIAIHSGAFDVRIGSEHATGSLLEPLDNLVDATKFQFSCQVTGSIAKWLGHARNFVEFPQFFSDGNLNSEFLLTLNPQTARLNQIKFEATDFNFDGFSLNIREPKLTGRANLKYDFSAGTVLLTKSRIASATVAANTDQLLFDLSEKVLADGVVSFRANANRASQWIGFSMPQDSVRWDGTATGTMDFKSEPNLFGGDLVAKVVDLVFVQPTTSVAANNSTQPVSHQRSYTEFWRESDLRVSSTIALTDDFNNVQISKLNLSSKTADIQLGGTINDLAATMNADLTGRWNVKWAQVNQTIRELAGDVITFDGNGWRPVEIKGPLYDAGPYAWVPKQLSVVADLAWNQANLYKLPLGTSQIGIRLDQSLANLTAANNSNMVDQLFQLRPTFDLRNAEPMLHLQQGTMLDHREITAIDSRTWLKYAAPLIADATSAQGQVSATLEGATVPLFDPMNSSAKGVLDVHSLSVGPGPLAQQLLPMIDQILAVIKPQGAGLQNRTSWLQLKPQKLPFAVQQGRVHHDGFEMSYKEIVIRTRGSVGFDQTLDMVAEIPILEDWVGDDKIFSRLIGQSISIPVSGTLSKPRLDRRAVTQLTQQLIRESALGAVNDKVSGEVGKLQEKVGGKIQGELNQFREKVNGKIQSEFEDKIQDEFKNGLNKLFGGGKK